MSNDDLPTTLRGVVLRAVDLAEVEGGRELARVSEARGAKVSHGTLNGLINGTYSSRPSEELLRKLAVLAQMTLDDVRTAARVPNPGPPFADELPEGADYIVGTPRKILLDAIRLFAQQGRRTAELEAELEELRNDARSAAIKVPEVGPAEQPTKRDYDLAANETDELQQPPGAPEDE